MINQEYTLRFTKRAKKDIERLDSVLKKRLANALMRFSRDPFWYAKKLTNPEIIGQYLWRIGDYRVIFDLQGH